MKIQNKNRNQSELMIFTLCYQKCLFQLQHNFGHHKTLSAVQNSIIYSVDLLNGKLCNVEFVVNIKRIVDQSNLIYSILNDSRCQCDRMLNVPFKKVREILKEKTHSRNLEGNLEIISRIHQEFSYLLLLYITFDIMFQ